MRLLRWIFMMNARRTVGNVFMFNSRAYIGSVSVADIKTTIKEHGWLTPH